jgi:hypothetical protein
MNFLVSYGVKEQVGALRAISLTHAFPLFSLELQEVEAVFLLLEQ